MSCTKRPSSGRWAIPREFGSKFFSRAEANNPHTFHIFMSHFHYDHVQGIPFFGPAYIPNNKLVFHGCHEKLEQSIRDQMQSPYFPVTFEEFKSTVSFEVHQPRVGDLSACEVETVRIDNISPSRQLQRLGKVRGC